VARRPSVFAAGAGSGVVGVLLALAVLLPATAVAEEPARKDVLLLYADSMLLPANVVTDRELRSALGADAATPVRFYTEALDLSWFPDKEVERAMLDLLRAKYANRNLDLVIPVGPPALRFALLYRATIFPGVPLVFVAAREAVLADLPLPPDVTGMWMDRDWRANVELILRLHPDTRRIAFVSGGGMTPSTADEFRRVAASYRDRVEPIELTDRTFEEMLKEAAALPEHTVILVGLFLRDRAGRTFTNAEVAGHVARTASVPVYSALDVHVGRGIVGGYVVRWEQQAARAAALALRVLRGERLGPAAATSQGTNGYVFDARVLKRWRIDRQRLPPESVVLFHVAMPGMGGLEALRRLKADASASKVIFLTMHSDAQLAAEALRAGASGFVVKHAAGKELIAAIHTVLRGGKYLPPHLASDVLTTLADSGTSSGRTLTPRQREVASLIAEGRTMKEVAALLRLSPRTVETHKYQIMAALGLQTTAELIRYALEHGLTTPRHQG
jgi:two-component system, NarL family, response regulator NreC